MNRILVVASALGLSLTVLGCGGSGKTPPADMSGTDGPESSTKVMVCGTTLSPEIAFSQIAAGATPDPVGTGIKTVPFTDQSQTVTASDAMGSTCYQQAENSTDYFFVPAQTGTGMTGTTLPTLGDQITTQTAALMGESFHYLLATSNYGGGVNDAITTVLGAAGGPAQAALLAQGACVVDTLASHNPNPVPEPATLTADAGWDIYSLSWDAMGNVIATKSGDGGMTGRFVITKNGNTTAGNVNLQATDKMGTFTYPSTPCYVAPGNVTFIPLIHS